jgi:hypothetical protein
MGCVNSKTVDASGHPEPPQAGQSGPQASNSNPKLPSLPRLGGASKTPGSSSSLVNALDLSGAPVIAVPSKRPVLLEGGVAKHATLPVGQTSVKVPGSGFSLRYAALSQRGYYPDAPDKANQDAFTIRAPYAGSADDHFFGVFDGELVNCERLGFPGDSSSDLQPVRKDVVTRASSKASVLAGAPSDRKSSRQQPLRDPAIIATCAGFRPFISSRKARNAPLTCLLNTAYMVSPPLFVQATARTALGVLCLPRTASPTTWPRASCSGGMSCRPSTPASCRQMRRCTAPRSMIP